MNVTRSDGRRKSDTALGSGLMIGIGLLFACVCTPVSLYANSDIQVSETVFPLFWDFFQQLVQILMFWIAFAFLTHLSVRYNGLRGAIPFLVCCAAAILIRYFGSLAVTTAVLGRDSFTEEFPENLLDYLLYSGIDLVQIALGVPILWLTVLTRTTEAERIDGLSRLTDLRRSNPIRKAVWAMAAVPSAVALVSRIVYDVFYGAPRDTADLLWMIFYYLCDVLSFPLGVFAVFLILALLERSSKIYRKDEIV